MACRQSSCRAIRDIGVVSRDVIVAGVALQKGGLRPLAAVLVRRAVAHTVLEIMLRAGHDEVDGLRGWPVHEVQAVAYVDLSYHGAGKSGVTRVTASVKMA